MSEIPSVLNKLSRFQNVKRQVKKEKTFLLLLVLPVIYFIIFRYIPIYGIQLAFKEYNWKLGVTRSPWADKYGLYYFIAFFRNPDCLKIFRNTILLNLYGLIFAFPIPIIVALLLNECPLRAYKKAVQTISYMPHFISTAAIVGLAAVMLSPQSGIVNRVLARIGIKPVYFLLMPQWFRPIYIGTGIWQNAGFGAIIYLAALAGINEELYEAAIADGASRFRRIWHISLPGIRHVVVILLILQIGSFMSVGFDKAFLLQNGGNMDVSEIIATYVYKVGILTGKFSYGTAVGFFNNVINFLLLLVVNRISRAATEVSLW